MIKPSKTIMKYIIVIVNVLISTQSLTSQSTWIYGFQSVGAYAPGYFVRLNYLNGAYDSLLYFEDQSLEYFGSSIDPFNGRYFIIGQLEQVSGNLHSIDLNTLEITSYEIQDGYRRYIEYISFNNSLVYRSDSNFRKLDLQTGIDSELGELLPVNSWIHGDTRYYDPHKNAYIELYHHEHLEVDIVSSNAFTGEQISQTPIEIPLFSMHIDYESGNQIGYGSNGKIYEFDPFSGTTSELMSIPDHYEVDYSQQAVYDQVNNKYIIFYVNINRLPKVSVIDMATLQIDTTYTHPNPRMELQEIYCKPRTLLSLINDTIYTSHGLHFQWYVNDILNPYVNTSYFKPFEQGIYQTLVDYPMYSSLSNTITYKISNSVTEEDNQLIHIDPNPFYKFAYLSGEEVFLKNSRLMIYNLFGQLILSLELNNTERIDLEIIEPGLYTFIVEHDNKIIYRKKMMKGD